MTKSDRARPNLRNLARGQPCMVRLPSCDGGSETTVLAHYRMLPFNGVGIKPPDWLGAWACARCHDAIDGRRRIEGYSRDQVRLAHAEGVFRTTAKVNEMIA